MVESPQRIWIEANDECPYFYEAHELHDVEQDVIEYVRADLYAALEAKLAAFLKELSGIPGELVDLVAAAIRGATTSDDTPWATLSEDRKEGWRGDAERALTVVKEYLTARDLPRRQEVA